MNKCQRIPNVQPNMDNPEKLASQGTQDEEGATEHEQSRETGIIEYTRRRKKQIKQKQQKTKANEYNNKT